MKRIIEISLSLLVVWGAASCNPDDNNGKEPDVPDTPAETIAIDGNFSDWDTVEGVVGCTLPADANPERLGLKAIKFFADADYIYGYAEYENAVMSLEGVDPSWDGNGAWTTGVPTPLRIFLDLDGNPKTGMTCKPAFPSIGAEIGLELYQYMAVETGVVTLGWSQCNTLNVKEGAEDGDDFNALGVQYWSSERDNYIVNRDNFRSKIAGNSIRTEFAIGLDYCDELKGRTVNVSVQFMAEGWSEKGYLPQDEKGYITIQLP